MANNEVEVKTNSESSVKQIPLNSKSGTGVDLQTERASNAQTSMGDNTSLASDSMSLPSRVSSSKSILKKKGKISVLSMDSPNTDCSTQGSATGKITTVVKNDLNDLFRGSLECSGVSGVSEERRSILKERKDLDGKSTHKVRLKSDNDQPTHAEQVKESDLSKLNALKSKFCSPEKAYLFQIIP